ncbi:MAG: acyltransferase [Rhizobacter sp.]|nr:acyltransferase [Bacteriovorax sp.]
MHNRNPALDLLRSLAILSVLLLHSRELLQDAPYSLMYIFSYGWIGVDLFFVLSGFLIGLQSFKDNSKSPVLTFIIKRTFRTLPLYYTVLLFYVLVKPALGFPFNESPLPFVFFIQNFFSLKDFVQSWSLCIEEQFYFLFPLVFFNFKLKKINPLIWLLPGLFSVFYRFYLYRSGADAATLPGVAYNYQFITLTHLDGLSWGVFLASTYDRWSAFKSKKFFGLTGIILFFLTLTYIKPTNFNSPVVLSFQLLAISFSLILVGVYDWKRIIFQKGFEHIALYSYGLYLWNNLVARVLGKIFPHMNNVSKFFLFIVTSFAVSIATYYIIERPFMKLRSQVLKKIS